ncbi:Fc.00g028740.m01.CDS01 [Cosmosporella sp. VM-42]
MTSNSKWPDFRLASTLWSLVGSQSSGPDKQTANDGASSRADNHDGENVRLPVGDEHSLLPNGSERPAYEMTDPEGRPIDGLGGFDTYEHDAQLNDADDGVPDEDFGALEMFDSNATQAPYSSQMNATAFNQNNKAPEAVMFEDASSTHSRKSKRDKKDRKKKGVSQESASPQPSAVEEPSSRKHKKSKRKSAQSAEITGQPSTQTPTVEHAQLPTSTFSTTDANVVPSTQSKRKRKSSDAAEGKQRKKRKSHDHAAEAESQDVVEETQDQAVADVIGEESAADIDPSPSAARLRRRSQSREARSRESSAAPDLQVDAMDVDTSAPSAQPDPDLSVDMDLGADTYGLDQSNESGLTDGTDADRDVESLAREAWNEHINGHSHPEENGTQDSAADVPTSAQKPPTGDISYEVPPSPVHDANPPSSTTKRTRSARAKKAKPTYFEKSPSRELDVNNGFDELPSPSAMTPKPRKRAKKAAKKKAKAEPPLSQSMHGATDDEADDSDATRRRRNRMAGYTQGRFSDEELSRIARAVESFRSENDMTQPQVNEMIHAPGGTTAGDLHASLWIRVFATCPDRHRQKVINITRKKFHNFVARGTWTTEQDTELRDLIEIHGTKWSKIAGIINRHPEDVRDRYRNYIVCGDAQRKDAWDENEERNLAQYIMEAMKTIDELRSIQPSRELLKKPYEELIDWQNISERMERTRSRLQCITKWKAMNIKTHGKDKLVSYEPDAQISFRLEKARRQILAMPEEERYRLILAIQASAASTETKVPWQRLVDKQFRSSWHRSTQMLLWRRLKHTIPNWDKKTVRDCAQYLVDQYNQTGELPEVKDEDYNDAQEMEFLQTIPQASAPNGSSAGQHGHMSAEFVTESDAEDDEVINEETVVAPSNDPADVPDEAINPDLPVEPFEPVQPDEPVEAVPEVEPTPPKATRSARKTTYGRRRPARKSTSTPVSKRAAAKKTLGPSQDPIEDDGVLQPQPGAGQEDNSEIDEEQFHKKKTPSKFRPSSAGDVTPRSASESVMDDMEDLPARIPG